MEGLLFTYIFNLFPSSIQVYNTKTGGLFVCLFVCSFLTVDMCHKTSYCRNPPYVMKLEMPATRTCLQQTNSNLWAVLLIQQCWCSKETMPITALFQSIKTNWKLPVCLASKIQPLCRLDVLLPEVPTQDCTSLLTNNSFFCLEPCLQSCKNQCSSRV